MSKITFHDVLNFVLIGVASWLGFWLLSHNDAHTVVSSDVGRINQVVQEVKEDLNGFERSLRFLEGDVQKAEVDLAEIRAHMQHTNFQLDRILDYIGEVSERERRSRPLPKPSSVEIPREDQTELHP